MPALKPVKRYVGHCFINDRPFIVLKQEKQYYG